MECKKAKGLILSEYADGVLRGHALEELEAHLRSCPNCRSFASDIVSAGRLFKTSGRKEAPPVIWERIRAEITVMMGKPAPGEGLFVRVRDRISHLRPAMVAVAAAVLLVFILTAARIVSDNNSYMRAIAAEEMVPTYYMHSSNGAEYGIGTSVEEFLL
jgi:hypothetical protein